MIIACPECSSPFEIPDDRIAALVQIECPHCSFRMILDFAAANDPSLIEEGMQMASGYRSAADYRAAASGAGAEPAVRPARPPPLEEVTTRPETTRPETPTLRPVPEPEPPRRPPFEAIPTEAPRAPARQQTLLGRPAPHEVRPQARTPINPPYEPPPAEMPARGGTVVGPAPQPPAGYPDYDEDAPTRVHDVDNITAHAPTLPAAEAPVPSTRPSGAEGRRPAAQWTPTAAPTPSYQEPPRPEDVETRPEPELPSRATYRPAIETTPARAAADAYADELDTSSELDDYPVRRGGVAGTVVVSLLLLAALGLVGASLALKNTADPRPLLEDLIRETVKK